MRRLSTKGLSMLEMMFAMVVLFLVGAFVMNMFVQGSRQMAKSANREKLTNLARAKTSEIRMLEYADLDTITRTGTFPPPNTEYQYAINYDRFQAYTLAEARTATITVTHPDSGRSVSRLVRSNVPPVDPGQEAFNKFGCSACHSIPAAGYPAGAGLVPLDRIGDTGATRPYDSGSGTFQSYVIDSIRDPGLFDPFPDSGSSPYKDLTMTDYKYETDDPDYDAAVDVSTQEASDLAAWLETFNP